MPTSVVTGGAGFLGSHLSDALLERGHRVICVDNLETGSLANIEHMRTEHFAFVPHDLTEPIRIGEPVDFVYHLASPASPIDYLRLPLQTLKVGSHGTHNALGLAKFKRARFLLASTSEVYGDPQVHPQPETYWGHVNPIGPRGVYDEAKRYAEALTMAYHRQQGVDTAIVRIFNTYGPRMRPHDGRAIPTFVRQAMEQKPITVFGDGSQTRSFCYVDDLIRGLDARSPRAASTCPSTSATRRSSPCSSSPRRCSRSGAAAARSSSRRCPSTTPRSASPTSRAPSRSSAGSPMSRSRKDCGGCRPPRAPGCVGGSSRSRSRWLRSHCSPCRRRRRRASSSSASSTTRRSTTGTRTRSSRCCSSSAPRSSGSTSSGADRTASPTRRPTNPMNPNDPAYDWSVYDRTVLYSQQFGIKPVFSIIGTPPWANRAAGVNVAPTRMLDLERFATAAARRYGGTFRAADGRILPPVRSWLAWNEPNNPAFLRPQFRKVRGKVVIQSAIDYAKICNAVVKGVRKTTVGASKVACGVTGPRGNNNPNSDRPAVSPLPFLRAMKKAGAKGFDAYAHHPYYGGPRETPTTPPPPGIHGNAATAVTLGNLNLLIREVTRLYGNKRIWITEYGYQTNPPDRVFGVSRAKQAKYLTQAYGIAKKHPRIDMFIWFLLRDEARGSEGWQSGLLTGSGAKKPAFAAFQKLRG